jgi:hypothetical protein
LAGVDTLDKCMKLREPALARNNDDLDVRMAPQPLRGRLVRLEVKAHRHRSVGGDIPCCPAQQSNGRVVHPRRCRYRCGVRDQGRAEHRLDGIGDLAGGRLASAVMIRRRGWAVEDQHPAAGIQVHEGQNCALFRQFRTGIDGGRREMVAPDAADRRLAEAGGMSD